MNQLLILLIVKWEMQRIFVVFDIPLTVEWSFRIQYGIVTVLLLYIILDTQFF